MYLSKVVANLSLTLDGVIQAMPTFLFGRRTYEDLYTVWHGRTDNPFSAVLDNGRKYVASTTLEEPLVWQNSTLLEGDVPTAVARLKEASDGTSRSSRVGSSSGP